MTRKMAGHDPVPPKPPRAPDLSKANRRPSLSAKDLPRWKLLLFSLLPICLLLVAGEVAARIMGPANPKLQTLPLAEEAAGLFVPDAELFWSLRPNLNATYNGARVTTDRLGLRSPEAGPKKDHEFRILSLGESSTFGSGVDNDQTYTALLPRYLQKADPGLVFTAFNAGVSAWSSFQSLKYLELRGLKLQPDLVLFYHELNDYLPSTLRDSSNTEIGVRKTDRELYESRINSLSRRLLSVSALVRLLQSRFAAWSVEAFNKQDFNNPLLTIGLPDIALPARLARIENGQLAKAGLNEKSLGQRVSARERLENLAQLAGVCSSHGISLILIHPSYRDSIRHKCLLTRFCDEHHVVMYDSYDALHPPELPQGALFRDSMHPNAEGHNRLAKGLAEFVEEHLFDHGS
jgi:hypothetical protein